MGGNSRTHHIAQQSKILAHQTQQKVFSIYALSAVLARLVTSEEYHSTRFFCVSLEHETNPVQKMSGW